MESPSLIERDMHADPVSLNGRGQEHPPGVLDVLLDPDCEQSISDLSFLPSYTSIKTVAGCRI